MGKTVHLSNGRTWKTKKAALAHFSSMLARYRDGDRVNDASDESDLRALIDRYDRTLSAGEPKAGTGIAFFSRESNSGAGWTTSGFHIHRTDGTSTDFSFYRAVQLDTPTD